MAIWPYAVFSCFHSEFKAKEKLHPSYFSLNLGNMYSSSARTVCAKCKHKNNGECFIVRSL